MSDKNASTPNVPLTTYLRDDPEDLHISPRSRWFAARKHGICGWSPYPNHGGYAHWYCQRRRRHLGAHRFVNYVAGRIFRRTVHYRPTMRETFAHRVLREMREQQADV